MPTKYFGVGGNDTTGDGTEGNPYLTYSKARTETSSGDTIIALDGTIVGASGDAFQMNGSGDDRIFKAQSYRGATLQPNAADTVRIVRLSALDAADRPVLDGLVLDGLGQVTQLLQMTTDTTPPALFVQQNCVGRGGAAQNFVVSWRQGTQRYINNRMDGDLPTTAGFVAVAAMGDDGNHLIEIDGMELELESVTGSGENAIVGTKNSAESNDVNMLVKRVTGSVNAAAANVIGVIDVVGQDAPIVSGCDFSVTENTDALATDGYGIRVRGRDASTQTTDGAVVGNTVEYMLASGYGIVWGISGTDGQTPSGGLIAGNKVKGKYFASQTPHGIAHGHTSACTSTGNIVQDMFASMLYSICNGGRSHSNLVFDGYGPSYYAKGCSSILIDNSTAVVSSRYVQRSFGILHVNAQGATNTSGTTFTNMLVIVQDVSRINMLAGVSASQAGVVFTNNTYIIPDTVDIDTTDLFGELSDTPNATLAEWNALSGAAITVNEDQIIQLPQTQIDAMVEEYRAIAEGGTGALVGGSMGIGI